jgi:hypothetical protein
MNTRVYHKKRVTAVAPVSTPEIQTTATVATAPDVFHDTGHSICPDDIRLCAYRKWETARRPCGDGVQFWLEAEREMEPQA